MWVPGGIVYIIVALIFIRHSAARLIARGLARLAPPVVMRPRAFWRSSRVVRKDETAACQLDSSAVLVML